MGGGCELSSSGSGYRRMKGCCEHGNKPSGSMKVKSLCLTKHHAMKTYWGSEGIAPRILDLGTRWR
jgi:hypothetical protein